MVLRERWIPAFAKWFYRSTDRMTIFTLRFPRAEGV